MSEPLTLAEFERALDVSKAYDGGGKAVIALKYLHPLILRLLAGERERCKEAVLTTGRKINAFGVATVEDGAHKAISTILAMGDPTT